MWKVGAVDRMNVPGGDGAEHGFVVIIDPSKRPVVSFAYPSEAKAKTAAEHMKSALMEAVLVHPYP